MTVYLIWGLISILTLVTVLLEVVIDWCTRRRG